MKINSTFKSQILFSLFGSTFSKGGLELKYKYIIK